MCSWYFLLRHVKEMLTDVILKNKKNIFYTLNFYFNSLQCKHNCFICFAFRSILVIAPIPKPLNPPQGYSLFYFNPYEQLVISFLLKLEMLPNGTITWGEAFWGDLTAITTWLNSREVLHRLMTDTSHTPVFLSDDNVGKQEDVKKTDLKLFFFFLPCWETVYRLIKPLQLLNWDKVALS